MACFTRVDISEFRQTLRGMFYFFFFLRTEDACSHNLRETWSTIGIRHPNSQLLINHTLELKWCIISKILWNYWACRLTSSDVSLSVVPHSSNLCMNQSCIFHIIRFISKMVSMLINLSILDTTYAGDTALHFVIWRHPPKNLVNVHTFCDTETNTKCKIVCS